MSKVILEKSLNTCSLLWRSARTRDCRHFPLPIPSIVLLNGVYCRIVRLLDPVTLNILINVIVVASQLRRTNCARKIHTFYWSAEQISDFMAHSLPFFSGERSSIRVLLLLNVIRKQTLERTYVSKLKMAAKDG